MSTYKLTGNDTLIINGKKVTDFAENDPLANVCYSTDEGKYNRHIIEILTVKNSIADEKIKTYIENKDKYRIEIQLIEDPIKNSND